MFSECIMTGYHKDSKMKKSVLKFSLAVSLLCAAPAVYASAADDAVAENVRAVVVQEGDQTIITMEDQEYTIPTDEYQAELDRGLTPEKIANNMRISQADESGMGVTVIAMCIVLGALIVLSILFMVFGKVFARSHSKRKREAHGVHPDDDSHDDSLAPGEVIAAIALALAQHFDSSHDIEDTVLTIRRMKRAYSPWNSKIYNMRQIPELRKNISRK